MRASMQFINFNMLKLCSVDVLCVLHSDTLQTSLFYCSSNPRVTAACHPARMCPNTPRLPWHHTQRSHLLPYFVLCSDRSQCRHHLTLSLSILLKKPSITFEFVNTQTSNVLLHCVILSSKSSCYCSSTRDCAVMCCSFHEQEFDDFGRDRVDTIEGGSNKGHSCSSHHQKQCEET